MYERSQTDRTRRVLARALRAGLLLAFALGCASIDHSYKAQQYAGVPLSPSQGRGAERFPAELAMDETLARYVGEHGRPDYFYIVDRQKLYLFYTQTDAAAMFERVLTEPSQLTELGRIPGSLLKLLPDATRKQIEARRSGDARKAQAQVRQKKAKVARDTARGGSSSSPAAIAPGGHYIGGFDASEIVARMSAPLTAADPGVRDWHESRVNGGNASAYTAKVGRTQYEVRPDRVAFTIYLSASRAELPGSARLAIERVNGAIFAAKARAVTDQVMALAERSVADRSGRTSFSQRMAGRTVKVGRRVDAGVFTYSVHP